MVSIHDVAKQAGVSAATVSRVVNGTKFVSSGMRKRVENAIEQLNYQPSTISRNFRLQRTNMVGVLLPSLQDYFFGSLAFALEKAMLDHNLRPMFCSTEHNTKTEIEYLDMLVARGMEGIILVPSRITPELTDNILAHSESGTPFVISDNTNPTLKVNQVSPDNVQGAYLAATHLLELGHRRIGIIVNNTPPEIPTVGGAELRLRGIEKAYADFGLNFDPEMIVVEDLPYAEMGYAGTKTLLSNYTDLTAIFALTDEIALGAIRAATDLGVSVPQDLSIMGYGNIPLGQHLVPRLTTINHSTHELAERSVDMLVQQIRSEGVSTKHLTTTVGLVVRESTQKR